MRLQAVPAVYKGKDLIFINPESIPKDETEVMEMRLPGKKIRSIMLKSQGNMCLIPRQDGRLAQSLSEGLAVVEVRGTNL